VAGTSSAKAAGHRAGTGCETVYGRFYLSGFLFLRFGRLGVQATCCPVCKPNPLKARERGRLIA